MIASTALLGRRSLVALSKPAAKHLSTVTAPHFSATSASKKVLLGQKAAPAQDDYL